jgi:uncharacterized protein (DUF58 family)
MIRPTWYLLLIMAIMLGAFFEMTWLILFALVALGVLLIAHLWNQAALKNIVYKRRWHYRRGFPGEQFDIRIETENQKLLPVSWLRVSDAWPLNVGPTDPNILAPSHIPNEGFLVSLHSLRWFQRASRSYTLALKKRGIYQLGPYTLQSGDLLGMYESTREVEDLEYITVFPELLSFRTLDLPTDDPFGDRRSERRLFEDPNRPIGVRAYHPEDDFRRIHWPATARTGELQVKVYQPVTSRVMVVCLNVSTMAHHWLGTSPDLLEHLVKTCATIVYQGMQDGYAVGLYSNGSLAHSDQPFRIPPGRSHGQLATLLQALAGATSFVTGSFENFMSINMSQIPYGATVVLVTAFVSPELLEILLRLKRYRAHITLISLEKSPPPALPGILSVHMPYPVA